MNRRDEVIKRGAAAANRQFPEWLQDYDFPTLIEWIITPHISPKYEPFRNIENEERRAAYKTAYRVLNKAAEIESSELKDNKNEGEKNEDTKKT